MNKKMKNKKNKKTRYERVVTWKKKPKWDGILGGISFCICSIFIMALLFDGDKTTSLLMLVATLLLCKGVKIMTKSFGEEKSKSYIKIK